MSKGFEAWKARQAAKGIDLGRDDVAYEQFVDLAEGRSAQRDAGVVHDTQPGVSAVDFSEGSPIGDGAAYGAYLGELSGEPGRKRAVEAERQHATDRERKALEEARLYGYPLPRDLEHLRPRLADHGY